MESVGAGANPRDPNGEPEGLVQHPSELLLSAATHTLVKDMADVLMRRFPGFRWAIQASEAGKVFNVFCLDFSGRWGFRIKYTDIQNDPKRRAVVRAGLEILHRFRYDGIRYDPQRMAQIPRNLAGEAIPDLSGTNAAKRHKKRAEIELALSTGRAHIIGTRDAPDGSTGLVIEAET